MEVTVPSQSSKTTPFRDIWGRGVGGDLMLPLGDEDAS